MDRLLPITKAVTTKLTLVFIALLLVKPVDTVAQVVLSNPGATYSNTDGPTFNTYGPANVSGCTTVSFSLDYMFSLPWEGSGNMEISTDCSFSGCAGDPSMPTASDCNFCWDFLWVRFLIDGVEVGEELIGEAGTTDAEQDGNISFDYCTNGTANTASMIVSTQTWAPEESITFNNITITCVDNTPTLTPIGSFCQTDAAVALNTTQSGISGIWSGQGVTNGSTFTPSSAGAGNWTLIFTPSPFECASSNTINVNVNAATTPALTAINPLCENDSPITLNTTQDGITGTWSGTGVTGGDTFDPSTGANNYTLTFTPTGSQCASTATTNVTVTSTPTASPQSAANCENNPGSGQSTFDLTQLDNSVSGGSGNVTYYSSSIMDLSTQILNPSSYNSGTATIFAQVQSGSCSSNAANINLTVTPQPSIASISDPNACNTYTLPNITGTNLTGGQAFYTGANGTGTSYNPNDVINSSISLFMYDASSPSCSDQEPFNITINQSPQIDPINNINECNNYLLQFIQGTNLTGNEAFYTGPNGSGTTYMIGDQITSSISLFAYDASAPGCSDETSFTITINNGPSLNPITEASVCDVYTLPPISGTNLTGSQAYYTGPGGTGIAYSAGQSIANTTTLFAYDSAGPGCDDETSFDVSIVPTPEINAPVPQQACDTYTLPAITGTNLSGSEAYYTGPGGTGSVVTSGTAVNNTTTLFLYDNPAPGCPDEESVDITIFTTPSINPLSQVFECDSYTLPGISGSNLSGSQAYYTGPNGSGTSFSPGQILTNSTTLYVYDNTGPGCNDEESFNLTVTVTPDVNPIPNPSGCGSYQLPTITGTNLTGGEAYYTNNLGMGTAYFPGQVITSPTSLFIFDHAGLGCYDEEVLNINISPAPDVFPLVDAEACGNYTLPSISGSNFTGLASYFTGPGGTGIQFLENEVISSSIQLYAYNGVPGCEDEELLNIIINSPPDIAAIDDKNECSGIILPTITGTGLTGNQAYYTESGGQGTIYSSGDFLDTPGLYYAYDGTSNCSDEESFVLSIVSILDISCSVISDASSPSALDGVIEVSIDMPSTGPYTINWSGPTPGSITTSDLVTQISNLGAGFYTITVEGTDGCLDNCSLEVLAPNCTLNATATVFPTSCAENNDGSIGINVTGETGFVVFLWSDSEIGSTANATGLSQGNYVVTIADESGCDVVVGAAVGAGPELMISCEVTAPATGSMATDGEAQVTISGGSGSYDITLIGPSPNNIAGVNGVNTLPNLAPGAYNIFVIDANTGCSAPCEFFITDCGMILNLSTTDPLCEADIEGSIVADVTGGTLPIDYDWSINAFDGMSSISNLAAGIYNLTATDADGCQAVSSATIERPPSLNVTCLVQVPITPTGMSEGAADIIISGGAPPYMLDIQGPTNFTFSEASPTVVNLTNLPGGIYQTTLTDANGCTEVCTFYIEIMPCPLIASFNPPAIICEGDSATVNITVNNANGPLYFDWSEDEFDGQQNVTGLIADQLYSVAVVDSSGCVVDTSFTIDESMLRVQCNVINNVSVAGGDDGEATIVVQGTTPPLELRWFGPVSGIQTFTNSLDSINLTNLPYGLYQVELSDSVNCSATCSFFIDAPNCNMVIDSLVQDASCTNATDGFIDLTITGGLEPLIFQWSTGASTEDLTNIGAGFYDLKLSDSLDCAIELQFIVEALNPSPTVLIERDSTTCDGRCLDLDVQFTGTAPFTIDYSVQSDTYDQSFTFNATSANSVLSVCPNLLGFPEDTFQITFNTLSDAICVVPIDQVQNAYIVPSDRDTIMQTLCRGESIIVNGTTYDEGNPMGTEVIVGVADNGCDSIIYVELMFLADPTTDITTTICPDDNVVVNGTTYDINNPSGTETFTGAGLNGCDSIVNVMLSFFPVDTFNLMETICPGDTLFVNGNAYTLANPGGIEVLPDAGANSCDSIINVMLDFYTTDIAMLNQQLCTGDSIVVNGTVYNETNPNGTEIIIGAGANGCDSIVNILLTFGDAAINDISPTLCPGDSIIVNGVTYNESNLMGSDTIPNGSVAGCDSIVNINLSFFTLDTVDLNRQLCTGDSLIINGVVYNEGNPMGIEVLTGAAANGCDSTINISLTFSNASVNDIAQTLCPGDSLIVNGVTYNEMNAMGSDTIPGGSAAGCDSVINVMLTFFPTDTFDLNQDICPGDSLIINGTTYNASNSGGIEVLSGAGANGCDSIINVSINVLPIDTVNLMETICPGDTLFVNGNPYTSANPGGTEILVGASSNGCDSVINVMIDFFTIDFAMLNQQLCTGDSIIVDGTVYNETNPNGTEVIAGASVNGCDSIVIIMLTFGDAAINDISPTLCPGDSLIVNGVTYNESNLMGSDTIPNGSVAGCDSIININLSYFTLDTVDLNQQLCTGDSLIINGTVYNEANPAGIEVLAGAAATGCDSTVNINLTFSNASVNDIAQTLCPGDSLIINGVSYNELNPMGSDTIPNGSVAGCDSVINVMLTFLSIDTFDFAQTLCSGDSLIINGSTYNEANATGTEVLIGVANNGCDSIINVMLTFLPTATFDLNQTVCPGDSLIVNGTTYNESNPSGTEILVDAATNGCDSIINVALSFFPSDTVDFIQQLCTGDSLIINGTTYNEANPGGVEILTGADVNGCDSIINVILTFGDAAINDIDQTLCLGDSLIINGITYNEANPMGADTIPNGSVAGCDSIINVMLSFFPNDTVDFNQQLCTGDSLIVNGTTYNAANPSGIEVLTGATINGCDSIVNINLTFGDASINDIAQTLCPGDSLIINGVTYNEANPMGADTIPNGSVAGCDSIINVMLSFFPVDTFDLNQQLCAGDSLVVNGTTYNEANPNGLEILSGAGSNGCDSIINVMLSFLPNATFDLSQTICAGDSLIVNGTTYNEANASGTELLIDAAANGCDSIITVSLSFFPIDTTDLSQQLCTGDSLIVNGTTYNATNPIGIETLAGASVNGCDSIISINLTFGDASVNDIVQTLCPGDSLIVNGVTYNELNAMGSDTILNGSVAGCDSIINVMLSFFPLDTLDINQQLCTGDSLIINGTTYNAANPTGLEILAGASVNGCDSIVNINLSFGDAAINDINQTICSGDSIVINGTTYNEANPMGADTIPNGSVGGCDSIINVLLSFFPIDTFDINQQLCTGDSLVVNGTVYNEANPSGLEILSGAGSNGCDSIINVMLTFGDASINDIVQTLCVGDSLIVNGITYNEANPMGADTIPNGSIAGCDSIINVMLSFFPIDTFDLNQQLCTGDSLIVNGTTYNEANANGIEVITGGAVNGCDSIINVMLTFGDASINDIAQTLCAGDSLIVNGITYNEANPMGADTIPNGSIGGCDSIINVMLSFFPVDTFDLNQQLCTGDSLIVNGTTYNEANANGIEVITGGAVNGCDSIINVMLTFGDASINDITQTLCVGDSLIVNGITYNEANPMGADTIPNGSVAGCDSIINVMLSFFPIDTFDINQQLCTGDSLIINGTTYNEANANGIEVITGGTVNGCDSIINVMLTFFPTDTFDLNQQLCTGDSLIINGTTYNEANTNGIEVIMGGSVNGCDSIINVMLTFGDASINDIAQTLCVGDSLIVNGITYNEANPMGADTIPNGSVAGCDSIINVMLSFFPVDTFMLNDQICPGDSIVVNGTTYNETNPSGIEILPGATTNGCDSIISVMIDFLDIDTLDLTETLCPGDSILVNGTTYNEANPTGIEIITDGGANGCDSVINVMLNFFPSDTFDLIQSLCTGDSIIVNGTIYNEANPSGIELLADATVNGCDSIINIDLTFNAVGMLVINDTLCAGDFINVNGTLYDESNPSGTEIILGGSSSGCDSIVQIDLSFLDPISGFLEGSTAICTGDSATLTIQLDGADLYTVTIGNGISDIATFTDISDGFSFNVGPLSTTTYTITILDAAGNQCPADIGQSATITVETAANIDVEVLSDYEGFGVSCAESEDGSVGINGLEPGASVIWNTGATTSTLDGLAAGTYIATVTSAAGCSVVDSAIITAPPALIAKTNGINADCFDPLNGGIFLESLLGGTAPYEYSLDGEFFQSLGDLPFVIPNVAPGNYDLIIQDVNDCQVQTQVFVGESPELILELGEDITEFSLGDSIQLRPVDNFDVANFTWMPLTGILDSSIYMPFVSPTETTTYQLTAFDSAGCVITDQITIFVNTLSNIYTPNVFSPNDDGRNDRFTIFAGNDVEEITIFRIFDRWGNMVFENGRIAQNNELLGWDGSFNGEPMNPAVFVFYAEIQFVDGRTEVIKGDVTLVR